MPKVTEAKATVSKLSLPEGQFLAHSGIYIFTAEIFDCLDELVSARGEGEEVGLTEAEQALLALRADDFLLYHVAAETLDTGNPAGYAAAQAAMLGR